MTTLIHHVHLEETDLIELTAILEKSTHHGARRLLDIIWRTGREEFTSINYDSEPVDHVNLCGK